MTSFQPADNLRSRTFIGLLIAQFLAAFNDQAIHASAMFFAINTETMIEKTAIALMPVLFYAPWAIFCTLAGYFADRYSKRSSMVFWKVVEIGITLLALSGFWLGRTGHPTLGAWVVLSTVFLMGMHSAFFVPAKYGAMPEILTPRMLSRGNGVLESLSFLAVILGTVVGGILSERLRGREYLIGVILTGLAVIGALASLFIQRIPTANPNRQFPPWIYKPLVENIRLLLSSRPLVFAVIGIAFFTFLVAFMRSTIYMHGQAQAPPWDEAKTSIIAGMVALGVGIGSPLVGYLSGGKVEVGLVPIGALGMVLATSLAALALADVPLLVVGIIFIGFFTGFYLVPLFSLLQHRAPKTSKGDAIATSNFINITGAIVSAGIFFLLGHVAVWTGFTPPLAEIRPRFEGKLEKRESREGHPWHVRVGGVDFFADRHGENPYLLHLSRRVDVGDEVSVLTYGLDNVTYVHIRLVNASEHPPIDNKRLPALLFLGAGGLTLFTLLLLWWQLPDLFLRTRLWLRGWFRYKLEIAGMLRLPANGPVVLVTDAETPEQCSRVLCATDRVTTFLLPDDSTDLQRLVNQGKEILGRKGVVGVSLPTDGDELVPLLQETGEGQAPVLPVHYAQVDKPGQLPRVYVIAGKLLPARSSLDEVCAELHRVNEELQQRLASGEPLEREEEH